MAFIIRWTPEAEETFDGIIEYLLHKWTEKEVRNFARKSQKVIEQIRINPFQFKASNFHKIRTALITKHNSLLYYIDESEGIVELYSFWDNRQNPDKLKK